MPILYKNILNGEEVLFTASDYKTHLANRQDFEQLFLEKHRDIVESWTVARLGNGTVVYKVKYKAYPKYINILWGPLKNSGTDGNDNKRIQVLPSTPFEEATPYFAIGAYNAGDVNIYVAVIGGISTFIRHAQEGSSYSSFWIDYPSLWCVYNQGIYSWSDTVGRSLVGCKDENTQHLHDTILEALNSNSTNQNSSADVRYDTDNEGGDVAFEDYTGQYSVSTSEVLPRNPMYRDIALERENYTCELCGTKETFIDRNNNEYFEGHHLIMYNPTVQSRFKLCLDHPSNIICLCPECHRKIHNSSFDETKAMVLKLVVKHHKLLTNFDIKDLEPIIKDYLANYD